MPLYLIQAPDDEFDAVEAKSAVLAIEAWKRYWLEVDDEFNLDPKQVNLIAEGGHAITDTQPGRKR